jgi:AraC family transcriptional regulator
MSLTNKALFIIERNISGDLSLAEIAKRCDVSRFHLAHAFGESTGQPVMEYVRGRRLTEAAYALASGADDILSVALDAGYASHEAFSRAFKAQFGRTPEEVRKSESVSGLKLVDAIRHLESKGMKLKGPRSEKPGEMLFVGLAEKIMFGDTQTIAGQWQRFMSGPFHEIAHKTPEIPVGINLQDEDGAMTYICAAQVTEFGKIPGGLTKAALAPQTYLVFAHDDHITKLDDTYAAIWNEWFPEHEKTPAEAPGFQRHNETFDPRTGNGGVTIWIPVAA